MQGVSNGLRKTVYRVPYDKWCLHPLKIWDYCNPTENGVYFIISLVSENGTRVGRGLVTNRTTQEMIDPQGLLLWARFCGDGVFANRGHTRTQDEPPVFVRW